MMGAPLKDFSHDALAHLHFDELAKVIKILQHALNKDGVLRNLPLHCDIDTITAESDGGIWTKSSL